MVYELRKLLMDVVAPLDAIIDNLHKAKDMINSINVIRLTTDSNGHILVVDHK